MRKSSLLRALLSSTVVALLLSGCGAEKPNYDQTVILKGKLTKSGTPVQVDKAKLGDYARVEATFIPVASTGGPKMSAEVKDDGTFTLATSEGKPLPPGKYRVAVRQWEPYPQTDLLNGKFDEKNTPLVVEIGDPSQELLIDLDKPKG